MMTQRWLQYRWPLYRDAHRILAESHPLTVSTQKCSIRSTKDKIKGHQCLTKTRRKKKPKLINDEVVEKSLKKNRIHQNIHRLKVAPTGQTKFRSFFLRPLQTRASSQSSPSYPGVTGKQQTQNHSCTSPLHHRRIIAPFFTALSPRDTRWHGVGGLTVWHLRSLLLITVHRSHRVQKKKKKQTAVPLLASLRNATENWCREGSGAFFKQCCQ